VLGTELQAVSSQTLKQVHQSRQ